MSLSRQNPGEHSYDIVAAAMKPQATTLPAFTGVMTPNGYVVFEVLNSNIPEAGAEELAARKQELTRIFGRIDQKAYLDALEVKLEAKVNNADYMPVK